MWSRFINWWEGRGIFSDKAQAGAEGERLAAAFLRKKSGYKIVARNWRSPRDRRDEIDLVCRDGAVLVFVEVKTRAADALVSGYHAVDQAKKRVMLRACTAYLRSLGTAGELETYRFDVVEVSHSTTNGDAPVVRHFENVPLFPKDFRL
jgi:putative endonuclease